MALLNFLILVFLIIVYFRTITEHESGREVPNIDPIFICFSTAVGTLTRTYKPSSIIALFQRLLLVNLLELPFLVQ